MRTDEDYLRELELWSMYALSHPEVARAEPARHETARAAPPPAAATPAPRPVFARPPVTAPAAPVASVQPDPARITRIAALDWDALVSEVASCQACGLCKQRKQTVFGAGARMGPWLFVGEGPGAEEDESGEPFVGVSGKLLDAMLTAAGLARGREVYIANVVKCRPPGNRTPSTAEASACAPLLDRQIDLIQPKLIVALGKVAVTRLTGSDDSMASLRGQSWEYRGIPVVATYHPSYLLRNLPDKLKAWEDLLLARKRMASLVG